MRSFSPRNPIAYPLTQKLSVESGIKMPGLWLRRPNDRSIYLSLSLSLSLSIYLSVYLSIYHQISSGWMGSRAARRARARARGACSQDPFHCDHPFQRKSCSIYLSICLFLSLSLSLEFEPHQFFSKAGLKVEAKMCSFPILLQGVQVWAPLKIILLSGTQNQKWRMFFSNLVNIEKICSFGLAQSWK